MERSSKNKSTKDRRKIPTYTDTRGRKKGENFWKENSLQWNVIVWWYDKFKYTLNFWLLLFLTDSTVNANIQGGWKWTMLYTGCPRRNGQNFGRVFLMLNYTDTTQNTYIQSWMVKEKMAREVWNFDSCYTLIDYQIHIKTGRNMWFL